MGDKGLDGLDPADDEEPVEGQIGDGSGFFAFYRGEGVDEDIIPLDETAKFTIIAGLFSAFLEDAELPTREYVSECLASVGINGSDLEAAIAKQCRFMKPERGLEIHSRCQNKINTQCFISLL